MEQSIDVGLVKGHAYGITNVKTVTLEGMTGSIVLYLTLIHSNKLCKNTLQEEYL